MLFVFSNSVGHYPNTALKTPKKIFFEQGSGLSSLGRLMCRTTRFVSLCPPVFGKFSRGAAAPNAPSTAHGARSAASSDGAAMESLLRRSRCCDGYAQTSAVALILRGASSGCCCDGADAARSAAATELRRSRCCDGVAAVTEQRRPAPSRSFCASRLDATR